MLISPPMPTVAFRQDQSEPQRNPRVDIDGKKVPYVIQMAWGSIATPNGFPATTRRSP